MWAESKTEPRGLAEEGEPRRLDGLESVSWFSRRTRRPRSSLITAILVRTGLGVLVGLVLGLLFHRWILGAAIVDIAVAVGVVTLASHTARAAVERAFAWLGEAVGTLFSWVLLTPIFLVGFTLVRLWMWVMRADPLQLRPSTLPSYWLPADAHERKVRFIGTMFAGERAQARGLPLVALLGLMLAALLLAEGLLRIFGFGAPVLYTADAQAGFYPAPHQSVGRYGGRVDINAYGMRSPDYPLQKPAGVFRVLMIGDSTLYGGSYVDQSELYSSRLEQALQHAAAGKPVEVLAIGVNGWGPFNELGYVDRYGSFDADLVLIDLPTVDIYRPLTRLEAVPFYPQGRAPRLALEEVFDHFAWRARVHVYGPPTPSENAWNGKAGIDAYARLAQHMRNQGAEVLFEVLPNEPAGRTGAALPDEQADVERLRSAVSPVRVSYPTGVFRGRTGRIYHDRVHLDVAGHGAYAEFLASDVLTHSQAWARWRAGQ